MRDCVLYSKSRLRHGGIAQLGERLNGIQEVSGSIPLISTKKTVETKGFQRFSFFAFLGRVELRVECVLNELFSCRVLKRASGIFVCLLIYICYQNAHSMTVGIKSEIIQRCS